LKIKRRNEQKIYICGKSQLLLSEAPCCDSNVWVLQKYIGPFLFCGAKVQIGPRSPNFRVSSSHTHHTHTTHTHTHTLTLTHTHSHTLTLTHTHTHTHTHSPHTHTHSRSPLNERLARHRDCYLYNKHKIRTSVPSAGFEPAVP
jgi:hypothetical protein